MTYFIYNFRNGTGGIKGKNYLIVCQDTLCVGVF